MQDLLKRQVQDKEDAKKVEWLGRLPNIASGMEARAATISTVLGVDDLRQAYQTRGRTALETTKQRDSRKITYHYILDKRNA